MSRKRTVEDWRRAVFRAAQLGAKVQVLLLLLADHMKADRMVSVPRTKLAAQLGVHERRVHERIKAAVEHGFLVKTGGGYRGRTSEYQAVFPGERVTKASTLSEGERVTKLSTQLQADGVHPFYAGKGATRVHASTRDTPNPEVQTQGSEQTPAAHANSSSNEESGAQQLRLVGRCPRCGFDHTRQAPLVPDWCSEAS